MGSRCNCMSSRRAAVHQPPPSRWIPSTLPAVPSTAPCTALCAGWLKAELAAAAVAVLLIGAARLLYRPRLDPAAPATLPVRRRPMPIRAVPRCACSPAPSLGASSRSNRLRPMPWPPFPCGRPALQGGDKLFLPEQLQQYAGQPGRPLYLAVLGQVGRQRRPRAAPARRLPGRRALGLGRRGRVQDSTHPWIASIASVTPKCLPECRVTAAPAPCTRQGGQPCCALFLSGV